MGKHRQWQHSKISRRDFLLDGFRVLVGFSLGSFAFISGCSRTVKPMGSTYPVLSKLEGASPIATGAVGSTETVPNTTDQSQIAAPATLSSNNAPIIVREDGSSISLDSYRLRVDGLIKNPLELSYQSLMVYPPITKNVTLSCPGNFVQDNAWTGVPVSTILKEASCNDEATQLTFYSIAGYNMQFSLQDIEECDIFLAYKVDGQVLPAETGFPLRLVVPDSIGSYWVKWVERIEVS